MVNYGNRSASAWSPASPSRSCVVSSVHINLPLLGHDVAILFAIPVITPHLITPHGSGQAQTQEQNHCLVGNFNSLAQTKPKSHTHAHTHATNKRHTDRQRDTQSHSTHYTYSLYQLNLGPCSTPLTPEQ